MVLGAVGTPLCLQSLHLGLALLTCLSKLVPLEHALINGVFLSVLRGPHYVPLMLHFALTTVTELNDSFSQVTGEGQWIGSHLEETNEILLQLRGLIKSEDQFGCTKEIVLGCWCVNEWQCCGGRKAFSAVCAHFSCSIVLCCRRSILLCLFIEGKQSVFLPAVPRRGRDSKAARSSCG